MSTPRKSDRPLHARHHPPSPFGRARDPNYEFDLDTSNFPTPSKQNATRPRPKYRTASLAGAYHATSPRAAMAGEGIELGSTYSPRRTYETVDVHSPSSDTSNPPAELADVYRRIEEDGTLANFVSLDGLDAPNGTRPASRLSRSSSRASYARDHDHDGRSRDGFASSEASMLDEFGTRSPRRRTADYTKDEQRLRRVTGKDSPVFSKAKVGARAALTADNLQRREEEDRPEHISEDDGEHGPSLNLPPTWGTRATRQQDWLRNVSQRAESEPQEEKRENSASVQAMKSKTRADDITASKPIRFSPRWQDGSRLLTRNALGERTANLHAQHVERTDEKKEEGKFEVDQNAPPGDGAPIPNTPIVVYKKSPLTKPSPTKRDSQELLRKLSRTESPKLDQVQTPDQPKPFERRIYDKTPRVTGAWIDTPMTERVTEIPSDLTKDIIPPSAPPKENGQVTQQEKLPAEPRSQLQDTNSEKKTMKEPTSDEAKPVKRSRLPLIRPRLPKSGLATVIEDVSSGKEVLDLGDDTIESLQAIMDDPSELKTEEEEEAAYEERVLEKLALAHANGQESVDFNRLDDKLQSLVRNINEVKEGLNKLEKHVTRDASVVVKPTSSKEASSQRPDTSEACGKCTTHSDGRLYAAIPLPRLWTRHPVSRRLQPTKLGWFLLISLTWYVIECMMCEEYSHPIISETCGGYCLQPDAPHFPLVTVTMLWRWSHLSALLAPIITVCVAAFRLVAQLLGLWDGYVDEPARLGNIIGEIRINGTPASFPWLLSPSATNIAPPPPPPQQQPPVWTPRNEVPAKWEDDQGSMDDDEYL
ncbi:uncharacterized protein N7459_004247 [Penicillium hispanicum]|uniref:uncharacterized protein n=1 Tax=Penicillium hispanicum TaxID=1080232 RepID=UPI002540484E|nr:uncharacterized protein N7459_004247 [Penicillium hispanicum]KAJ5584447.1 hypothetical protein N7459_004247 [Penicillium hispanicum]